MHPIAIDLMARSRHEELLSQAHAVRMRRLARSRTLPAMRLGRARQWSARRLRSLAGWLEAPVEARRARG